MTNFSTDDFFNAFFAWRSSPQAAILLEKECAALLATTANIFGFHAVQLGFPLFDALAQCRIQQKILAGVASPEKNVDVECELTALPFAENSVDLLILPHVLEFASDPQAILREAERVLISEGHLLITGFSAFSIGVLWRYLGKKTAFPWFGRFLPVWRLKDWLGVLNFEVAAPAIKIFSSIYTPNVYTLHAIKRRYGMRLIVPTFPALKKHRATPLPVKTFEGTHYVDNIQRR